MGAFGPAAATLGQRQTGTRNHSHARNRVPRGNVNVRLCKRLRLRSAFCADLSGDPPIGP